MMNAAVGSYKIIEKIGEGGMGQVFRAVDTMLERDVAIKVLHRHLIQDSARLERFRAEAVTLAKLNHPNIATLYSFFEHQGNYYMVMEFVDGETFEHLIRREGQLPARQALELFCQSLHGFEHAHDKKVIHRDIKPSNLMLNSSRVVKITDFGIARVLGMRRMTRTGALIGTPEYMSPEQVRGGEPDERSDIYLSGILLYEMLTGRMPFSSTSDFEIMRAHVEDKPIPAREFAPDLSVEVERVIEAALEKGPMARFQTMQAFRVTLEEVLKQLPEEKRNGSRQSEPPVPAPVQVVQLAESKASSWLPQLAMVGGGLSLLIVIVVMAVLFLRQPTPPPPDDNHKKPENKTPIVPAGNDKKPPSSPEPSGQIPSQETKIKESDNSQKVEPPVVNPPQPVSQTTRKSFKQPIPYSTRAERTASLFVGQRRIKQKGQMGAKEFVVEVTYQNGKEVSRQTLSERVIK